MRAPIIKKENREQRTENKRIYSLTHRAMNNLVCCVPVEWTCRDMLVTIGGGKVVLLTVYKLLHQGEIIFKSENPIAFLANENVVYTFIRNLCDECHVSDTFLILNTKMAAH
jgi:hypothetical protein